MLNEKTLRSSIESGSVLPVYLIAGDDLYLKKQALDRIIKATVEPDDDMNLIRFEYGVALQQVYDELNGFPLMADKKCVVYSEFDFEDASSAEFEMLCELAAEPYDTSVFVIFFGNDTINFAKSPKVKKLMSAVEASGGAVVRLDHKTPAELSRWMISSAKKKGCLLSSRDASYILDNCSCDINVLTNEITKLCAYVKTGEITRDIIDKVCVRSVEASIFDLSVKIIAGDTSGAMKLLDELYYMNAEPIIILHEISSAYVNMYRAMAARAEGKNPEAMAADFGIPERRAFLLTRAAGNLRKFDQSKLSLSFDAILQAEKELKSFSSSSRPAVEKLIVRLIYIMKTGEALD